METDIATMTGQKRVGAVEAYKLNEVNLNGKTGKFVIREVLKEKGEDGKYPAIEVSGVSGVILKMRWRLSKYEPNKRSFMTSEYDNKFKDTVVEFSTMERGSPVSLKERYGLSTQRVLYVYLPSRDEIVRVGVKSSAFSIEEGEEGLGLFEYVDEHEKTGTFIHEFVTEFKSASRKGALGDYYAMTFACGRALAESEKEKVVSMVKDVHGKTTEKGASFAEGYVKEEAVADEEVDSTGIPF